MKALHTVSFILLVIGGLNWLLVGLGVGDVVTMVLGTTIAMIIFILVGLSALYLIFTHKKTCKECTASGAAPTM